jgi:glycogen debranching enzyme
MEEFARKFDDRTRASQYREMASRTMASFNRQFWNDKENCLFDVVDKGSADASLRPNQVIAASLKHTMLTPQRARAVLGKVEAELLTPYGLRTLAPSDPRYIGLYQGDPRVRDSAYHQGTVWPWLLGPFVTGYVTAFGRTAEVLDKVNTWLNPLKAHLSDAGLGSISEIFNADPPHAPCGCIAQAWSVGEVLRVLVEDVHNLKPAGTPRVKAVSK